MSAQARREILGIALPVSAESVIQLTLNFLNQIIVGMLGAASIAAVGLSNSALFVGILCLNVLGSGCAILASRARGRGDEAELARVATFSVVFAFMLALLVALPLSIAGEGFLVAVGASREIAAIGGPYLSLYALALPLITASVVMTSAFRTIGQPRLPLVVTLTTLTLTPLLAWVFVTQLQWGVVGAAWASIATQLLRVIILAGFLFLTRRGVPFSWPGPLGGRRMLRTMLPLVLPLFVTEVVFSSGVFLFALLAERRGTATLAAFQIVSALEHIFIVGAMGFHAAATILTARAIGQASEQDTWRWSGTVWRLGVTVSVVLGVLFALSALLIPTLFPNAGAGVQQLAMWGAVLNAVFMPVKVSNMIAFGILASGGDTRYLLVSDVVTVVLVGLPLAYVLAFPLGLGLWGIFLGRLLGEETVRVAMLLWRYRTGRWFHLHPAARIHD